MKTRNVLLACAFALLSCERRGPEGGEEDELTTGSCGVERWDVKTGTDAAARQVSLVPQETTIASLRALAVPAGLAPGSPRFAGTAEMQAFRRTNVNLRQYKMENDSDYHLVLSDAAGNTMIAEIPYPGCVSGGPFASGISAARTAFDARFAVTTSFQTANIPVTVTGVGFFDILHGQTGVAPNGIELHSVLDICFDTSCTGPQPGGGSLVNGDFETGTLSGWTAVGSAAIVSTAHGGSFAARVGSTSPSTDSSISQTVSLPAGRPQLSFWYKVVCPDTVVYDWATVVVKSTAGAVLTTPLQKTCTNTGTWVNLTADLTAWSGQTVVLQLASHDDDYLGDPTYTLYDDVRIAADGSPPPQDLIVNGGFEGSLSGWALGGAKLPIDSVAEAHSGANSLRCGATTASGTVEPDGDSSAWQDVAIPASAATATLSFWYFASTTDTIQYDWQQAEVRDVAGNTLVNLFRICSNGQSWIQETADLSAYRGQTVRIWFNAHGDGYTDPTTLWVDDVSLMVQ